MVVEAGTKDNTFAFKFGEKYLTWTSGNSLNVADAKSDNTSWTVSFANGKAVILNVADATRSLQYNAGSPRFACYATTGNAQTPVMLWK